MMSIFQKISKVMAQVERVPKTGYNSFHKYHYATESDLTESIRPILQEAGLAFFSSVLEQERSGEFTKVKMEFTLADAETGEKLVSCYWGEGQDKGDKGLYKAYTGATKYFLMKTFLIPTGDDPEADNEVDKRNAKRPSTNPKIYGEMKTLLLKLESLGAPSSDVLGALRVKIGSFDGIEKLEEGRARQAVELLRTWVSKKEEGK